MKLKILKILFNMFYFYVLILCELTITFSNGIHFSVYSFTTFFINIIAWLILLFLSFSKKSKKESVV
jgi:hypothetical protein